MHEASPFDGESDKAVNLNTVSAENGGALWLDRTQSPFPARTKQCVVLPSNRISVCFTVLPGRAPASPTLVGSRRPDELDHAFLIAVWLDGKWLAADEQELVALGQIVRFVAGAHHHIAAQADQQQLAMKAE